MGIWRLIIRLCLAAVLATIVARPAVAHAESAPTYAPQCSALPPPGTAPQDMLDPASWTCSGQTWRSDVPEVWLRFDAQSWEGARSPRFFFSRIARFEAITFFAVDRDGAIRTLRQLERDARPFASGPVFRLPLPHVTADTRAVLVRIERPHSIPLLTEARLTDDPAKADWSQADVLMLAFIAGTLVLPLLFDIIFFFALRQKFVILHAGIVVAMMGYVLFGGGLISAFVTLPLAAMAVVAPVCFAFGAGLSALFLADFLERGAQSKLTRRITTISGWYVMLVPGFFALQLHATQSFGDRAYFYTFSPMIPIISIAVLSAVMRGSRSARYVAAAWAPMILASLERLLRGLGVHVGPSELDQMMFVAVGIEVVMISLAIADRFLMLRRERDAALSEARMLEQISTRDALTGLMNRRAIEARFDELLSQGFDTFALVDLDRFKAINDLHGHQVGDAALIACATALRANGDRDSIAVRLGGEEFVVLLRGERPLERAEAMRQAIPMRIAKDVPGLELPVSASMGVIVLADADRHKMTFSEFYARADALMYEAKASGRNRLAYERLTVFSRAPAPRRPAKGAA